MTPKWYGNKSPPGLKEKPVEEGGVSGEALLMTGLLTERATIVLLGVRRMEEDVSGRFGQGTHE